MDNDCDKAYGIIRDFLINYGSSSNSFGSRYPNVDDFFSKIDFKKYLLQFIQRFNRVAYLLELTKDTDSNRITACNMIVREMLKHNSRCLEFAKKVESFTQKKLNDFQHYSDTYTSDTTGKYGDSFSIRSSVKGFLGIGTKSKYERMTDGIPLCLYVAMDRFAKGILLYEEEHLQPLGKSPPEIVTPKYIEECLEKVSIVNLQQIVDELQQQGNDEFNDFDAFGSAGGSRRHTRHRHGRSRRHHSKYSHKSVKRSKKGKKIMKSHTRKRHTRARKQNRRRNGSRK